LSGGASSCHDTVDGGGGAGRTGASTASAVPRGAAVAVAVVGSMVEALAGPLTGPQADWGGAGCPGSWSWPWPLPPKPLPEWATAGT
jgi:hypothetical protein